MRTLRPSAVSRLLVALALPLPLAYAVAPGARAQATPDRSPAPAAGGQAPAHPYRPARTQPAQPQIGTTAKSAPLVVPAVPPAPPELPPPVVVPTRPPPPLTPPPVAEDAPGTASKTEDGLRITFGTERSDLNPATGAAINELVATAPGPFATFTVTAYAVGGDDPSTPRRLSLSRALAVRSALMQAGIASVRIYVKALGASAPGIADGPPDRVDIVVALPPPQAAPASDGRAPVPTQKAAP